MTWIAGVDGFKSQWFAVLQNLDTAELRTRIVPTFAALLTLPEGPEVVAVDIPMGLPDYAAPGGRACEREARRILGARRSSVFSALGREVLKQPSHLEASTASRAMGGPGVSIQSWCLAPKLREADIAILPSAQLVVREVHPEVSFWAMNDRVPMPFSKKIRDGARARQGALLRKSLPPKFVENMGSHLRVGRDDFLDACAALWTARRIAAGAAERFPVSPDLDSRGLDQAIWF